MDEQQTAATEEVVTPVATEQQDQPKDRTSEQFDKLTGSNKQLKQENEALKDVIASLTPDPVPDMQTLDPVVIPQAQEYKNLSQKEIDGVYSSMIDEQGYLDGNKLISTLKGMDDRVKQAELRADQIARQAAAERTAREEMSRSKEAEELHNKYPHLDPNSEVFDKVFYDAVRNEMIGQMLDGKQDPMAAADKWAPKFISEPQSMKKEEEKKQQADEAKSNINANIPRSGNSRGYYDNSETETLREGIMSGKRGALAEMLRRREQGKA